MASLVSLVKSVVVSSRVRFQWPCITCQTATSDKPESGLPELSVETDQGPGQILCGGRILKVANVCYVIDRGPQLTSALTTMLRSAEAARGDQIALANAG